MSLIGRRRVVRLGEDEGVGNARWRLESGRGGGKCGCVGGRS